MLTEMVKASYIQLDIVAEDFKDAIRKSAEPLLEDKAVTESYIEKIIEIYDETGPYIVITENVALPHAPSDAGAKKLAMGFTRLKMPVISGHESNDPVKYLFVLSAPDGDSHLKALSEFVQLLSQDAFYELIQNSDDKEEILEFLKEYERNEENE